MSEAMREGYRGSTNGKKENLLKKKIYANMK